jgi:hypothetical protein
MSDTPQNMVNILEHFKAAVVASEASLKEAKVTLKAAEKSLDAIEESHKTTLKSVNAEIEKTDKLIDSLAGEDATIISTLQKKASDLRHKLETVVSGHANSMDNAKIREAVAAALKALEKAKEDFADRENQRDTALELSKARKMHDYLGAVSATEFETLEDAVSAYLLSVPIYIEISPMGGVIDKAYIFHGVEGEPASFDVSAGDGVRFSLKVIPDDLLWLRGADGAGFKDVPEHRFGRFESNGVSFVTTPSEEYIAKNGRTSNFAHHGGYGSSFVCYVKSEGRFYSRSPKNFPSLQIVKPAGKGRDYYGRVCDVEAETKQVELDASCIFSSISKHILAAVSSSQADFKNLLGAKSVLASRTLSAVNEVASTESLFQPQKKRLDGAEISADVGMYWDAFIAAPWERCIQGNVAMLKHLCERKLESPHVWSNNVKGHYGLRVRTRDHTWIVAEVFCPPAFLSPEKPVPPDLVRYLDCAYNHSTQIVQVGPCYIKIDNR